MRRMKKIQNGDIMQRVDYLIYCTEKYNKKKTRGKCSMKSRKSDGVVKSFTYLKTGRI